MNFLVDAQLPIRLANWISAQGFDCKHVISLPNKEFSSDFEIIRIATLEQRVVITKDSDFMKFRLIKGTPKKLIVVSTGNISNTHLISYLMQIFMRLLVTWKIMLMYLRFQRPN